MGPEYTPAEENQKILSFRGIPCRPMHHPIGFCLFVCRYVFFFFQGNISLLDFDNLILFRDIFHYHCCYFLKKKKIDTVGSIWTR